MMRRSLCLCMIVILVFFAGCAVQKRPALMTPEERGTLLRQRITEFWSFMVDAEWLKAYPYYDPFYRIKVSKEGFMSGKGLLKYYAFNIEQVEIKGNIADVKVKVNFEAPKIVFKDKTTNVPRQDRIIEERWLWIDDNWHLEFWGGTSRDKFTDY
jgi:hypothetical protein